MPVRSTFDQQNQLLELFQQHGGWLKAREVQDANMPSMALTRLLEQGLIERAQRGVYRLTDTSSLPETNSEAEELLELQLRFPYARPFLVSALHLHGLTTTRPSALQLAIPAHRHGLRVQSPAIEVFYLTKKQYNTELTSLEVRGRKLTTYTPEKTICDLLRYANKFGRELYLEGLKNYLQKHSSHQLIRVAKTTGVWKKLSQDLEVLAHDQDH